MKEEERVGLGMGTTKTRRLPKRIHQTPQKGEIEDKVGIVNGMGYGIWNGGPQWVRFLR